MRHPGPWRKGEHSFEKGQQVLDVNGKEIAWIRYNEWDDVKAMIAASAMVTLLDHVANEVLPGEYDGEAAPVGIAEAATELLEGLK